MDSLPDIELLNKDQNDGTGPEGEKSGFQPNPTVLEALQANTSVIEALRKQIKDLQSKKKKRKHAYSTLVGESESTAFAKSIRQTKAPPESLPPISDSDMDLDLERDDANSLSSSRSARDTVSSNYFSATGSHSQLEPAFSEDEWPRQRHLTPLLRRRRSLWSTKRKEDDLSPSLATFLTKRFQTQTDPKKLKAKFGHYK